MLVINGIILKLLEKIIGVLGIHGVNYEIHGIAIFAIAVAIFTIFNTIAHALVKK